MVLSIVIPAFNEAEGIEDIILRALEAKPKVIDKTPITEVLITVVSDGSTDETVEIASKFVDKIELIVFETNRGYGAAIKEGWEKTSGDLLAFLDADGTCDPLFFIDLCNRLIDNNLDVVLGSRMHSNSEMPRLRKVGNRIFSFLLSLISRRKINDTASGMRVIRKSAIFKIMPLPDGLHFTPAMSARSVLSEDIRIDEIDMPYKERIGSSKLNVILDGLRFLKIILETTALYKPSIILNPIAILVLSLSILIFAYPMYYYIDKGEILEWMIYRFVAFNLLVLFSALIFSASFLSQKIVNHTILGLDVNKNNDVVYGFFSHRFSLILAIAFILTGYALIHESLYERVLTGNTEEHWSRFIAMATLFGFSFVVLITKIIDYFLNLTIDRIRYFRRETTK